MSLSERIEARKRAEARQPWCHNCGSSAHTFCNRPVPEWLRRKLDGLLPAKELTA